MLNKFSDCFYFEKKIAVLVTLKNINLIDFQSNLKRKATINVRKTLVSQQLSNSILLSQSFLQISVYVMFFSRRMPINE